MSKCGGCDAQHRWTWSRGVRVFLLEVSMQCLGFQEMRWLVNLVTRLERRDGRTLWVGGVAPLICCHSSHWQWSLDWIVMWIETPLLGWEFLTVGQKAGSICSQDLLLHSNSHQHKWPSPRTPSLSLDPSPHICVYPPLKTWHLSRFSSCFMPFFLIFCRSPVYLR